MITPTRRGPVLRNCSLKRCISRHAQCREGGVSSCAGPCAFASTPAGQTELQMMKWKATSAGRVHLRWAVNNPFEKSLFELLIKHHLDLFTAARRCTSQDLQHLQLKSEALISSFLTQNKDDTSTFLFHALLLSVCFLL